MAKANREQDFSSYLEVMSATELIELRRLIDQQIDRRTTDRHQEAVSKLRELADEYGLSINQLFELARGRKSRSALPPMYRHPENHELTWTGRGRRPFWLISYIGDGGALNDLRIWDKRASVPHAHEET